MCGSTGNGQALVLRNTIYQSNPLIQSKKDFDIIGMRIFLLGLRGLNPHFSEKDKFFDADFKEMFIPTDKLTELFGGNTRYLHDLENVCDKMFRTVIKIHPSDGGFELYHLFRKLKYVPRKGLYIWFDDLLRPYILDLFESKGYTKLNVKYLFCLSSPYAVRLLELMLQYQNIKSYKALQEIKRKFTVEELRFSLNVPENAYVDRIDNFRTRVLDVAIKEINNRTPYILRYETVKAGRCVVAFDFTMDTFNVPVEEIDGYEPNFSNDAIELLHSMGFSEKASQAIFKRCCDVHDCFSRINRARALLERQTKPVKNKLGFLRKAIEEDWQMDGRPSKTVKRRLGDWSDKELPPPKPKSLRIGRNKIPHSVAKVYVKAIRSGEHLELVNESLKEFNVTIAEFEKLCKKHGL